MKIKFKKIRLKNFMSIGASPVDLEYVSGLHAIVAKLSSNGTTNGQGKSNIGIDGLVFALFGKSIRNLNLKEMINNINQAECEVTVWFSLDDVNWRVERGLAPDYLRLINEDNEESDKDDSKEDSAKKITQQKINSLLGISYKSFINSITLNINYSKPFFKLDLSEKRQILEDVMNLVVYGRMFEKIKKQLNEYKVEKRVLESELKSFTDLYKTKLHTYEKLEEKRRAFEVEKDTQIKLLQKSIQGNTNKIEVFKAKIPNKNFKDIKESFSKRKDEIIQIISDLNSEINSMESSVIKNKKDYEIILKNPICPFCKTPTEESSHTQSHLKKLKNEIETTEKILVEKTAKKVEQQESLKDIKEKITKIDDAIEKVKQLQEVISRLEAIKEEEEKQLDIAYKKEFSMDSLITKEEVEAAKLKVEEKEQNYNEVCSNMNYSDYVKEILGDQGVKKYIIKKIIPLLNKKTNEYLSLFKAKYSLSFDSELNETFKSRNREERTYNGFSSGEQKRIDLAFMFALLDVAKQQSSIDSNILILDEIIDSSICSNGIHQLMSFLKNEFKKAYPDMCVYIISHKAEITEDHFNSIITIKKDNEFTKIDSIRNVEQIVQV
jgi:DNA repair exonuclease SbcCD ATPase subunit